ncbi:MAG: NapC/NirT family cytochrome c [Blastocatellia bacterium]
MSDSSSPADKPVHQHPGLYRNLISLMGAVIAVFALVCILFLFLAELTGKHGNPYLGILTFIIFPAVLIFGLLLIPAGMLIERRRRRRHLPDVIPAWPRMDLNDPRQRRSIAFVMMATLALLFMSTVGSYRAYEYTETTTFCGQLCHTVMEPEFVAYKNSPHSRVACVDCHVGPGATWYVRSKLSGAYQVYATIFKKYPKPITTPISNLRPSQETCEQCHWPEKFFGAQLKVFNHFGDDESNTPRQIRMLINTGGGSEKSGFVAGIHWHMNIANEINYVSTDAQRQIIPWVQLKEPSGKITEFFAKDTPLKPEELSGLSKRRMECVDCHNRPTHIYVPPDRSVDTSLIAGRLDRALPFIKQQAVLTLTKTYQTKDEALKTIAADLESFYRTNYGDRYQSLEGSIKGAISEVQRIFATTIFPEMKVDWRTHPDNINHYYFSACFRCHDGQHVSREGRVIRNECNICHTILEQTEGTTPIMPVQGKQFEHSVDLSDFGGKCTECHNKVEEKN